MARNRDGAGCHEVAKVKRNARKVFLYYTTETTFSDNRKRRLTGELLRLASSLRPYTDAAWLDLEVGLDPTATEPFRQI